MPPAPPPSRWGRAYSQSRTGSPVQAEGENGALPPRRVVGLETARARLPARLSLSRNDRGRRASRGSPEHWSTPADVAPRPSRLAPTTSGRGAVMHAVVVRV